MAQLTIYKDASINVVVIDGVPPVDQAALVAQLQAEVATLTASLATVTAERNAALNKIAAGQVAVSAAQAALA